MQNREPIDIKAIKKVLWDTVSAYEEKIGSGFGHSKSRITLVPLREAIDNIKNLADVKIAFFVGLNPQSSFKPNSLNVHLLNTLSMPAIEACFKFAPNKQVDPVKEEKLKEELVKKRMADSVIYHFAKEFVLDQTKPSREPNWVDIERIKYEMVRDSRKFNYGPGGDFWKELKNCTDLSEIQGAFLKAMNDATGDVYSCQSLLVIIYNNRLFCEFLKLKPKVINSDFLYDANKMQPKDIDKHQQNLLLRALSYTLKPKRPDAPKITPMDPTKAVTQAELDLIKDILIDVVEHYNYGKGKSTMEARKFREAIEESPMNQFSDVAKILLDNLNEKSGFGAFSFNIYLVTAIYSNKVLYDRLGLGPLSSEKIYNYNDKQRKDLVLQLHGLLDKLSKTLADEVKSEITTSNQAVKKDPLADPSLTNEPVYTGPNVNSDQSAWDRYLDDMIPIAYPVSETMKNKSAVAFHVHPDPKKTQEQQKPQPSAPELPPPTYQEATMPKPSVPPYEEPTFDERVVALRAKIDKNLQSSDPTLREQAEVARGRLTLLISSEKTKKIDPRLFGSNGVESSESISQLQGDIARLASKEKELFEKIAEIDRSLDTKKPSAPLLGSS